MIENNPLTIVPKRAAKADPEVVGVLQDMLKKAEEGEVISVAIVAATRVGEVLRFHSIADQRLSMLAGLQLMTVKLSNHLLDDSRQE